VEKKKGFDVLARSLFEDLKGSLNLEGLSEVRVLHRYDVEGIDEETADRAKISVFSEPALDVVYDENLPEDLSPVYFAVEYLPGQFDQRADSADQCIQMMNTLAEPNVKYAKVIALGGDLSQEEIDAVKKYCINPVDSQEAKFNKPDKLVMDYTVPENVARIEDFLEWDEEKLEDFRKETGFAMSKDDLVFVHDYFSKEKRNPTITELRVIDTYWSDHCRHTTFMTHLTDIQFEEGSAQIVKSAFEGYLDMRREVYEGREKEISLMDIACIGAKYIKKKGLLEDLDESEEINACSIKVKADIDGREEDWLVMFKNETHNHPTEIEPFGGAATCLGGAIRDPLSGRSFVYQAMRVTGAADPRRAMRDTLPGKLPQRKITQEAAAGYSAYGNQIGLATGQVTEIYDDGYMAKRMEIGAVIGAAPASHVRRAKPENGDRVILIGGRTGRDGCGGATGSSKEHTEESITSCGAEVQKGNPPVERNIQRLFRRKEVSLMIKRCNDFGAGGVSVAIGELADSLDVQLDLVPKKYEGLDGTELAISESQERMAVVVSEKDRDQLIAFAQEENLEATEVARITETGRFRMFWREDLILDLSREFLNTNGAVQKAKVLVVSADKAKKAEKAENKSPDRYLNDLNCCSQKGLGERFDSTIGASTVLMPFGGKYQLSPALGMAAKLPVLNGQTNTATLMAFGFDPELSKENPFLGAMSAVVESVTKIIAMGGQLSSIRLSFQEYFEKMTEDPKSWGKPFAALLGALKVQKELGIPAIGGKDSMSGTFMDLNVPPTLVSFAVTACEADRILSTEFKKHDSNIVLLRSQFDQNGVIDFDRYKRSMDKIAQLSAQKKILAAQTVGAGGIFMSLVKMSVGNKIGFQVKNISETKLCERDYGAVLLEISSDLNVGELFEGVEYEVFGGTSNDGKLTCGGAAALSVQEAIEKWMEPLEKIFPVRTSDYKKERDQTPVQELSYHERSELRPLIKTAKPRVLIPVFPGTNCEVDSRLAFERAGAIVDVHLIRNLTKQMLMESIAELAEKIRNSQIIMIPGGFSGGDEPDGSAKFITAVFRNQSVREAATDLMENRDGLMLGICNGFQALIKLGLLPYGKIIEPDENSPTLTFNKIGRHMSCLVRTRIASVKSPWLSGVSIGDIHTIPISHGEGRLIASSGHLENMIQNGQIATQYVDLAGKPSMDIEYNPNGSVYAVEGITSPDGRILGKMAHSERISEHVYKNVSGVYDQKIFESGVEYFK